MSGAVNSPKIARYAEGYCRLGLKLTRTAPGEKGPRHGRWNDPACAITNPREALKHWTHYSDHGIAALLAPSGLVSIDVDDEDRAQEVMTFFGVDLHELRATAPTIIGRHYRMMFRAPDLVLAHRSLAWPTQDDPRKSAVLFEFRAGNISDTLPPTIHPGTGQPYRWENPPRNGFPALPPRIVELWQDWPTFSRQALALCPWAPPPPPTSPARSHRPAPPGESVIDAFNDAHDVGTILESHNYTRKGRRFASPDTTHSAGIVVLESGKVYCHQSGDPLRSDKALDAFDLFRILDHGGDFRAAVKAAAALLGIKRERAA